MRKRHALSMLALVLTYPFVLVSVRPLFTACLNDGECDGRICEDGICRSALQCFACSFRQGQWSVLPVEDDEVVCRELQRFPFLLLVCYSWWTTPFFNLHLSLYNDPFEHCHVTTMAPLYLIVYDGTTLFNCLSFVTVLLHSIQSFDRALKSHSTQSIDRALKAHV